MASAHYAMFIQGSDYNCCIGVSEGIGTHLQHVLLLNPRVGTPQLIHQMSIGNHTLHFRFWRDTTNQTSTFTFYSLTIRFTAGFR